MSDVFTCNKERTKKLLTSIFPCVRIMRKYDVKNDLINDVISGLTVGIMQLPQGETRLILTLTLAKRYMRLITVVV